MHHLRERAETLRRRAEPLEPGPDERRRLEQAVVAHTEAFLDALESGPAYQPPRDGDAIRNLELGAEGRSIDELLALITVEVERQGVNPAHPRHFGWVPGGGLYTSALGDYLAAVADSYAGHSPASPGAVRVEHRMLRWIAELVGYPTTAGGVLTSGGSVATLTALLAARDVRGVPSAEVPRLVVYATDEVHYAAKKALHILGLHEAVCRTVPVDERYRMAPGALAGLVAKDRANGLSPWLVLTTAGTVNTGAIDPLEEVSAIARAEGLWHHVDAAYGGFYMLVDDLRPHFRGIEQSDSVALDPHKSLFLPYATGAVVLRDAANFDSLCFRAPYLTELEVADPSPAERSIELTKHFRGMRMLFPLFLHGVAPFAAALEEKVVLARYLWARVAEMDGFEVGPEPDLTITCFRRRPAGASDEETDQATEALQEAIHADGHVFVTGTRIGGRFWLRPCIEVFRTHAAHVDDLVDTLHRLTAAVTTSAGGAGSSPRLGSAKRVRTRLPSTP